MKCTHVQLCAPNFTKTTISSVPAQSQPAVECNKTHHLHINVNIRMSIIQCYIIGACCVKLRCANVHLYCQVKNFTLNYTQPASHSQSTTSLVVLCTDALKLATML